TAKTRTDHQRQLAVRYLIHSVHGPILCEQVCPEGYTEALRLEGKPFNIHVSLTEAGFLRTPIIHHRQVSAARIPHEDPWRQRAFDAIRDHENRAPGAELVAQTLADIIGSERPRLRNLIGSQAKLATRLQRFLPEGTYERGKRSTFRLDE